jgi:hypothetical protein
VPEPIKGSRLFEDGFEYTSQASWTSLTGTYNANATYLSSGARSLKLAGGQVATKVLNRTSHIWERFYLYVPALGGDGTLLTITADGVALPIASIMYDQSDDKLRFYAYTGALLASWARPTVMSCVEFGIDFDYVDTATGTTGMYFELYLDGVKALALAFDQSFIDEPGPQQPLLQTFYGFDPGIYVDDLAIDRRRIGLVGQVSPNVEAYTYSHDVEIDGVGFNLVSDAPLQKKALSAFNPKLGVGAPKYSDLSGFQHHVIESQHSGIGQPEFSDEFKYLMGMGVDTIDQGMIRLANKLYDHNVNLSPPAASLTAEGYVCAAASDTMAYFGVAFGTGQTAAAGNVLYAFDGTSSTPHSFTTTHGIQDILYNGKHVFVTLGGGRVMKNTPTQEAITFNLGTGTDSITFDDGAGLDSVTFESNAWSNVGSDILPPDDMGQMSVYDEFLWVAERQYPWLHRTATVDGSDLEGYNEDYPLIAAYDTIATRVGAGDVPITALCSYQDKLYVGREDGLYRLWIDGEATIVKLVEPVTRRWDNYRGMCVYNGFLCFHENGEIYQFNGTAKQNISPGVLSDLFPYKRIQRWGGLWAHGRYLFATGSPTNPSSDKSLWYIMVFCQGAWCILGQLHDGYLAKDNALPMPMVHKASDATYMRVCSLRDSDNFYHITSQDTRHGASGVGATQLSGYILSSTFDFGLPQIPRLMSQIKLDVENIVEGTNNVSVDYYADNSSTLSNLGVLAADDCTFLEFPTDAVVKKIRLKHTLETSDELNTPVIRRTLFRYMDRPETVWGYVFNIHLLESAATYASQKSQYGVEELRRLLEGWRDRKGPILFRDPQGNTHEAYVTDIAESTQGGESAMRPYIVTVTLMLTDTIAFTPPARGLTYAVT